MIHMSCFPQSPHSTSRPVCAPSSGPGPGPGPVARAPHGRRVRRRTRLAIERWLEGAGVRLDAVGTPSAPVVRDGVAYRWATHRPGQVPRPELTLYRSLRAIDDQWTYCLIRLYWHRQTWRLACEALEKGGSSMPDILSRWLAGEGASGVPDALVRAFGWATAESIDIAPAGPVYRELPEDWQIIGLSVRNRDGGLPDTYEEFELRQLLGREIGCAAKRHIEALPAAFSTGTRRKRL